MAWGITVFLLSIIAVGIGAVALLAPGTPLDDFEMAEAALDLPKPYDAIALNEMRTTRMAGVPVTRAKARHIVSLVTSLAREHGVTASVR